MKNRILSVVMVLAMILSIMPIMAVHVAAEGNIVTSAMDDGGTGTLRQVIATAAPDTVITFSAGITTITLSGSEIAINKNLEIKGNTAIGGGPGVTVDANGTSRIFRAETGVDLKVSNLIFANGKQTGSAATAVSNNRDAAAIFTQNNLTVENCHFTGNITTNGNSSGGAICVGSSNAAGTGNLVIRDSLFKDNTTVLKGGAIYFESIGVANIYNTRFEGNTVTSTNVANARGGGIYINHNAGRAHGIYNSVFSGNTALRGGAIYTSENPRILLANSTIINNISNPTDGTNTRGAVALDNSSAHITVVHSTVVNNTGGGICPHPNVDTPSSNSGIYNSIIVGNGDGTYAQQTTLTTAGIKGHNIIQDASDNNYATVFGANEFQNGVLLPLATYPGITNTFALTSLAPSVVAADWSSYNVLDQTGKPRASFGMVTFGSVELPVTAKKSVTVGTDDLLNPEIGSLRKTINDADAWDEIEIASGVNVTLMGEILIDKPLAIRGLGASSGNRYNIINANEKGRIFNYRGPDTAPDSQIEGAYLEGKPLVLKNLTLTGGKLEEGNGGAIYSAKGLLWVDECAFEGNIVTGDGNVGVTDANYVDTTPEGTGLGAAIYVSSGDQNGGLFVARSRFTGNTASRGGGIYATAKVKGSATPTGFLQRTYVNMESCFFAENTATDGSAYRSASRHIISKGTNSTFYKNNGTAIMEGINSWNNGRIISYTHCTVVDNNNGGRAIQSGNSSTGQNIYNSIITGNSTHYMATNIPHNVLDSSYTTEQVFGALNHDQIMADGYIMPLADGPANKIGAPSMVEKTSSYSDLPTNLYEIIVRDQAGNSRPASGFVTAGAIQVATTRTTPVTWDVVSNADSGEGSLREIITQYAYPGDTIRLMDTIPDKKIVLNDGIIITNSLTFIGMGDTPITLESAAPTLGTTASRRIFNILHPMGDISFDNIRFTGGRINNGGGAAVNITVSQTYLGKVPMVNARFTNCSFEDNQALAGVNGGAVRLQGIRGTFTNCLFKDNITGTGGNSGANGGAIYAEGGSGVTDLTVINSSFIGNQSSSTTGNTGGSAIFITNIPLNAINSTFYGNRSGVDNVNNIGVIRGSNGNMSHINLYHCTVVKNDIFEAPRTAPTAAIVQQHNDARVRMYNSIVAGNGNAGTLLQQLSRSTGVAIADNRLDTANSLVQDTDTHSFDAIFGDNQLLDDRYIRVKDTYEAAKDQAPLDGTEVGAPADLLDLVKYDQRGTFRRTMVALGAVELKDFLGHNATTFYNVTAGKEIKTLEVSTEPQEIRVTKTAYNANAEPFGCVLIVALYVPADGKYELIKCVSSEAVTQLEFDRDADLVATISVDEIPTGSYIATYLWSDDLGIVKPLAEYIAINNTGIVSR